MQPECSHCGYAMTAFDAVCPRCQGKGLGTTATPNAGARKVPAAAPSPTIQGRISGLVPSFAIGEHSSRVKWVVLAVCALLLVGGIMRNVRLPVKAAFDVPSLVDKPIDEVKASLGAPIRFGSSTEFGPVTATKHFMVWKRGRVELRAEYQENTRKVHKFFLTTDDPSGESDDRARTLALGNLEDGEISELRYRVSFLIGKDDAKHIGVNVYMYI